MSQLQKAYLLLSSIVLCIALTSCSINKYHKLSDCKTVPAENALIRVVPSDKTVKFKTTIDVLKNHLSGIVLVKQTDSTTKHIVFVTELGMKMFDFEVKDDSVKALYVFDPLNKPALVNVLKENFKAMLLLNFNHKIIEQCKTKSEATVFCLHQATKQNIYLSASLGVKPTNESAFKYFPYMQETFKGKKRISKIDYEVLRGDNILYNKITCKQYGLIKFYFELINITE